MDMIENQCVELMNRLDYKGREFITFCATK